MLSLLASRDSPEFHRGVFPSFFLEDAVTISNGYKNFKNDRQYKIQPTWTVLSKLDAKPHPDIKICVFILRFYVVRTLDVGWYINVKNKEE